MSRNRSTLRVPLQAKEDLFGEQFRLLHVRVATSTVTRTPTIDPHSKLYLHKYCSWAVRDRKYSLKQATIVIYESFMATVYDHS